MDKIIKKEHSPNANKFLSLMLLVFVAAAVGFLGGYAAYRYADRSSGVENSEAQKVINSESSLITDIAEKVGPSVVSVNVQTDVQTETFFGRRNFVTRSAGTGFIISKDGVIVTNRHVVPRGVSQVSVTLSDGTELDDVDVLGRTSEGDPLDIAFLKINDKKGKDLTVAKLGDSTKVQTGDKVVAIGNALGQFQNTITLGIISGYGRNIEAQSESGAESLQNLFQTDAAINQGNSGGPLVNMAGEVIAINTAVAGRAENIGFAIPISDAQGLIKGVLETGRLERPYLGVRYVTLTDDIAYKFNLNTNRGAYIAPQDDGARSIFKDSPADKAGLQEKDIITKVNDITVDEKNSLASILGRFSVGDKVSLTVVRGDETITVEVTLEAVSRE